MDTRLQAYTTAAICVLVNGIIVVDVVLTSCHSPTISATIRDWSSNHPWIPLSFGILIGHLFF